MNYTYTLGSALGPRSSHDIRSYYLARYLSKASVKINTVKLETNEDKYWFKTRILFGDGMCKRTWWSQAEHSFVESTCDATLHAFTSHTHFNCNAILRESEQ